MSEQINRCSLEQQALANFLEINVNEIEPKKYGRFYVPSLDSLYKVYDADERDEKYESYCSDLLDEYLYGINNNFIIDFLDDYRTDLLERLMSECSTTMLSTDNNEFVTTINNEEYYIYKAH